MSMSHLVVEINRQPIELCKLLKIANLVSGGGEAKIVISEGYVLLNGDVEFQKRKKVYHHDVVEFNGDVVQVEVNESLSKQTTKVPEPSKKKSEKKKNIPKEDNQAVNNSDVEDSENSINNKSQRKRRPISF